MTACKFILGLSLAVGALRAQGETLTWKQCVDEALASNPTILAAVAGVKNAKALFVGSYSNFLPQLSLNASFTETSVNGGAPVTNPTTGVTSIQSFSTSTEQYAESLAVTQNVFNGFTDVGKIKQARANIKVAQATLDAAKALISTNLKTAFAELLFEEKSIELTATILKRQQANLRMVTLRYEGGNEHRGNQLYQVASVTQAQYAFEHAQRQVRNGSMQLATLMGRPRTSDLRVVGELTAHAPAAMDDFSILVANNPNHVEAYQTLVAAQDQVTISNGNWYPNLNLTGNVGYTGSEYPPNASRWSAGVVFSYPLFPGTSQISLAESGYALEYQAQHQVDVIDMGLIAGMESAYAGLLDAIGQVKVAQDFYIGARARSVIADGKYNTGLMVFEDWTVIDADYTTRQTNLLTNQRNAMQAEATWEGALGRGDIK